MWNQLLKLTLVSYLWKRYRRTIITFPLLMIYFWVVNLIHQDYLAYHEINDTTRFVGFSFLIKWVMIFAGIAFFVAIHLKNGGNKDLSDSSTTEREAPLETISKVDELDRTSSNSTKDAFANIRKKTKLRSKADVVLEKKKRS